MDTPTLAYTAGLFDGEGSVSIQRSKPSGAYKTDRHRLRVQIAMCHEPTIRWLADTFGFNFFTKCHKDLKRRNSFHADLQGLKAAAFLRMILPYLRTKKEQAELGITFQESCTNWFAQQSKRPTFCRLTDDEVNRREMLCLQMNALNARGIQND